MIEIRLLDDKQTEEAFSLIWEVFLEFVAPDYTQEGIDNFYQEYVHGAGFRNKFTDKREVMYGAFVGDNLAGVLSFSDKNTVSCVFVRGKYHKMGIGRCLFEKAAEEMCRRGSDNIKLNASPYAVPFYHHLGFQDTGAQAVYKGIVYTPMELLLKK